MNAPDAIEQNSYQEAQIDQELTRLFPKRNIQRVLLVAAPDVDSSLFNYDSAKQGRCYNYPMYGAGILAVWLQKSGIDVQLLNLNHEILKACSESESIDDFDFNAIWKARLLDTVEDFQPDLIGLTCMFTQTHRATVQICNELKKTKTTIPLAIGGVHITNSYVNGMQTRSVLDDFENVDLFFLYESEAAFDYFVRAVNRETPAGGVYKVYFNSSPNSLTFSNRQPPDGKDLNIIPAFNLMDVGEVSQYGVIGSFNCLRHKESKFATILSNRGCRAQCTFCSVRNFNGRRVRIKDVQTVIDELLILRNEFGIDHVMWLDDDILFNHQRVLTLFNEMVRQNVGITWDATNGVIAASCTEEIIAAASESGCLGLNIGMESGNPEILKNIKKPGKVRNFLRASEVFRKFPQINARVFLIIGFPNESYRMLLDTFNVAKEMALDWYNITILQPLPNTPIFDTMVQLGLIDSVVAEEIRYNSGPYGKKRQSMQNKKFTAIADPFENVDLDDVPPQEELDSIWVYMNFHLNFKPLLTLEDPIKQKIQLKYLRYVTDLVAPDDPFPLYFRIQLQKKVHKHVDTQLFNRLETRITTSEYWTTAFERFDLSLSEINR